MHLIQPLARAEAEIGATISRERAALKSGHLLAARALHVRLEDAARTYIETLHRIRAMLEILGEEAADLQAEVEERRRAFGVALKIDLATLAAARAAAEAARDERPAGRARTAA